MKKTGPVAGAGPIFLGAGQSQSSSPSLSDEELDDELLDEFEDELLDELDELLLDEFEELFELEFVDEFELLFELELLDELLFEMELELLLEFEFEFELPRPSSSVFTNSFFFFLNFTCWT